jgi:hypothetical protein
MRFLLAKSLFQAGLVVSLLTLATPALFAQMITIRLLDGRNGQPLRGQILDVWLGDQPDGLPIQLRSGNDGIVLLPIPRDQQVFVITSEFAADCRPNANSSKTVVNSNVYSFNDVDRKGIVTQNSCGAATIKPVPGQLTFFVRPLHWWEKMQT